MGIFFGRSGGCFTNVLRALQNNLAKIYNTRNDIYGENFKLKLCTCAQSMALGTRTKFQLEILIRSTISAIYKFRENILESSQNVSEPPPPPPPPPPSHTHTHTTPPHPISNESKNIDCLVVAGPNLQSQMSLVMKMGQSKLSISWFQWCRQSHNPDYFCWNFEHTEWWPIIFDIKTSLSILAWL